MPAERALAASALFGLRTRAEQAKNLSAEMKRCVIGIQPDALVPTYRRMLESVLTRDEIAQAEDIYGSELGPKIVRLGIAMYYQRAGKAPPDGEVTFTASENAVMDRFAATAAGDKLFKQALLDSGEPRKMLDARIGELLTQCRDTAASAPSSR